MASIKTTTALFCLAALFALANCEDTPLSCKQCLTPDQLVDPTKCPSANCDAGVKVCTIAYDFTGKKNLAVTCGSKNDKVGTGCKIEYVDDVEKSKICARFCDSKDCNTAYTVPSSAFSVVSSAMMIPMLLAVFMKNKFQL